MASAEPQNQMETCIMGGALSVSSHALAGLWSAAQLDRVHLGMIPTALTCTLEGSGKYVRSKPSQLPFVLMMGMGMGVQGRAPSSDLRLPGILEVGWGFFCSWPGYSIWWTIFLYPSDHISSDLLVLFQPRNG